MKERKILMKKIGIVTLYHKNYNYGGQLQAYAMQKIFTTENTDAELITFENDSKKYLIKRLKDLGFKKSFRSFKNKIQFKKLLRNAEFKQEHEKKIARFDKFIDDIPHTKLYNSATIAECNEIFDSYVCGSDQIWNPGWWNDILVLGFANKPRFSYAASIARTKLTEEEVKYLKDNTDAYEAISVRESQAQEMLKECLNRDIDFVLDPTLLVDAEHWASIANNPSTDEEYAFIYMVGNSKGLKEHIYEECHKKGLKVISIGYSKNTYFASEEKYSDMVIKDAGPNEWLGWIRNAKYVFTDSFHGSVFSILFQRQFWCFERDNPKDKQNENSRLYSFLSITGLEKRLLAHDTSIFENEENTVIDYEKVKNALKPYRERSFEFINKYI